MTYFLHSKQKGFTLIELMVVVTVIALMSTIVLIALGVSRNRGNDAHIKANMVSVATQAQLYFENNGNYGTIVNDGSTSGFIPACFSVNSLFVDPNIANAIATIETANGAGYGNVCVSTPTGYMFASKLSDNTYWCIDAKNIKKSWPVMPPNSGVNSCP